MPVLTAVRNKRPLLKSPCRVHHDHVSLWNARSVDRNDLLWRICSKILFPSDRHGAVHRQNKLFHQRFSTSQQITSQKSFSKEYSFVIPRPVGKKKESFKQVLLTDLVIYRFKISANPNKDHFPNPKEQHSFLKKPVHKTSLYQDSLQLRWSTAPFSGRGRCKPRTSLLFWCWCNDVQVWFFLKSSTRGVRTDLVFHEKALFPAFFLNTSGTSTSYEKKFSNRSSCDGRAVSLWILT